ncbi:unnamed protein product, partial [Prorocentrum cordatum]
AVMFTTAEYYTFLIVSGPTSENCECSSTPRLTSNGHLAAPLPAGARQRWPSGHARPGSTSPPTGRPAVPPRVDRTPFSKICVLSAASRSRVCGRATLGHRRS